MQYSVGAIVKVVKSPANWPEDMKSRVGQVGIVVDLNYPIEGVLYYVSFQDPWMNAYGFLEDELTGVEE